MKNKENVVLIKSYAIAIRIVNLYKYLIKEQKEFVMSKQVLDSGTAIGALIRESVYAQSRADFINKLSISIKEASETSYWLELLYDTKFIDKKSFLSMHSDCEELLKLLTSSIKTSKKNKKLIINC